jgi:hypothetical protein
MIADLPLLLSVTLCALVGNIVAIRVTRTAANPVSIISATFFLPLCAALLRLSDLQAAYWADDTYYVLYASVVCWIVLPTALLLAPSRAPTTVRESGFVGRALFPSFARTFAAGHVGAVLLQNYIVGGTPFLFLDPVLAVDHHTATVPVLQILGRAGFVSAGLLFLSYAKHRRRADLFFLGMVLVAPITKLARIDLLMIAIALVVMNAFVPVVRVTARRVAVLTLAAMGFIYGLVELGNQRVSQYGKYTWSYAEAIGFRPMAGPGDVFAVIYGYFPLSFENLDRFVRNNRSFRTHGLLSFNPLFNTVFFAKKVTGTENYPTEQIIVERRNPIGAMATVGTALSDFYLDFGASFAWLPMALYMMVWTMLFRRARASQGWLLAYGLFSSAMALASFQAVMAAAVIYQAMLLGLLPFAIGARRRATERPELAS